MERKHSYLVTGPPYEAGSEAELFRDLARTWANGSRQMAALAAADAAAYRHVLQPNQYVPDSKPISAEERATAYVEESRNAVAVRRGYPELEAAGRQLSSQGIAFRDLTGIFADSRETLYTDSCCHLNAEGYRRVVAALCPDLRAALSGP